MKTRDKIKFAAVEMFNELGATNVSTVQLSEKLKISPGNLYYYFDNKEHLIRDIWAEDIITNIDMLFFREDFGHSENGILNFFDDYSKVIYKFRFYYAELFALLKNDSNMLALYRQRCKKLLAQVIKVMESWEETGIMNPINDITKQLMSDNLWIVSQNWVNFATIKDPEISSDIILKDSVLHAYAIVSPMFTDSAKERVLTLLKKKGIIDHIKSEGLTI